MQAAEGVSEPGNQEKFSVILKINKGFEVPLRCLPMDILRAAIPSARYVL